jgi:signal transduction histidine kinase
MLVDVKHYDEQISVASVLTTILSEFSAITEYRTLQDSLPRRLAGLLKCRCVLFYHRTAHTLQFVAGSLDDTPGWSSALLRFAHINPVDLNSNLPEACACRERHVVAVPSASPTLTAVPLIYRQKNIGVLVAIRNKEGKRRKYPVCWTLDEIAMLEAVAAVVALLLENTRLLERDRERIHELSLLNNISSQMNGSMYELKRVHNIVIQRTREVSTVDLCELMEATGELDETSWITPRLRTMLFQHFRGRRSFTPLVIERSGSPLHPFVQEYLDQLPGHIKTFFAIPLLNGRGIAPHAGSLLPCSLRAVYEPAQEPEVLGIIVGGYYHAWKLRRTEIALLQVLASQASAVLENISLMAEVVEARNEARKLLRQVLDDITSVHRLEEEKRRLDRLASLGEMAANVAHEVRNPLASIKTSMQMLMDDLAGEEKPSPIAPNGSFDWALESVSVVLKEVERLDCIVRDLLLFAKPRQLHRVRCDVLQLSDRVLQFIQPQCIEAKVVVQRAYDKVPLVWIDDGQLEQVMLNIYMNALQAMPDGGILTVSCHLLSDACATPGPSCGNSSDTAQRVYSTAVHWNRFLGDSAPQQWLELSVSDTGSGIPPEQLERIFQPFFTTKAHGIGLGLAITRRLVEDHGGYLRVEGKFGYGATVSVRLPIIRDGGGMDHLEDDE